MISLRWMSLVLLGVSACHGSVSGAEEDAGESTPGRGGDQAIAEAGASSGGSSGSTASGGGGRAAGGHDTGAAGARAGSAGSSDRGGGASGEGGGSELGSGGASPAGTAECVAKVNEYRARVQAPPLTLKADKVACAAEQARKGAEDLAMTGTTVFHAYFTDCGEKYQNEGWYSADDVSATIDYQLDAMWSEGPPASGLNHYSVMTDPASTQLACALVRMPDGGYWMTQDYY